MIVLQIQFQVPDEDRQAFETLFDEVYLPALRKQQGFAAARLLRVYPPDIAAEIAAAPTSYAYQMELEFTTETARRAWVTSSEHQVAWDAARALATATRHRGYDLVVA